MEIARSGARGKHPAPCPLPFPDAGRFPAAAARPYCSRAQCAEAAGWIERTAQQVVTGLAKAASEHRP